MVIYNERDRVSIENEEDGPQDRALGNAELHGGRRRGEAVDRY